MVPGTEWDKWVGRWHEFVLWLIKPFTRCGNDNLCPLMETEFVTFNAEQKLWELATGTDAPLNAIYVYYCPWCGRKLKDGKP